MNTRTLCETRWDWTRDRVLDTWPDVSENDLDSVAGDYEGLVTVLSETCGYGWDEAAERLDEMAYGS